ncbi:tetratricopeptide repeat protein [Candidatus Obscuribacterales bacterium]|nr:tetratricopeptide repeat protein [Candidatus Obscuribacterales bacterium]
MTSEERGSQLFSEAIRALEDDNPERAEQLFVGALNNLEKKHHLAILSLKSLVTITSNKGDFDAAIDWSLQLLEAQTGALGHTHADVSRTVMNIATMCETLGKHDIAKEVKELHHYASTAERAQKAQQVKNIRTTAKSVDEDKEPEEDEYDEKVATFGEYWKRQKQQWRAAVSKAGGLIVTFVFLLLLGAMVGGLFGLKMLYTGEHNSELSQPKTGIDGSGSPTRYITADNRVELQFVSPTKMEAQIDGEKVLVPFSTYGYSPLEIGDLLMSLPFEKELWLHRNPDGLTDGKRTYLHDRHMDRDMLAQIANVADMSSRYYKKRKVYPDKITEIGDFTYFNPYTQRNDYPLIQVVTAPGHSDPGPFLGSIQKGALWPGEPMLYPGCINIGHISHQRNMSVPETLVIHGCNRNSRFFTTSTGDPFYLVFEKGEQKQPTAPKLNFLRDISKVCVLDIAPAWAGLVQMLITARFVIFFALLFIIFYAIAGMFDNDTTKKVAYGFVTIFLLLALTCIYFAYFF